MIIGVGTDLTETKRIKNLYIKYKARFLNKVFQEQEIEYCFNRQHPYTSLAARFALKEAFIKALNLSNKQSIQLSYKDIFLTGKIMGKKEIEIQGNVLNIYNKLQASNIFFSISHTKQYATAFVIIEK